MSRASAIAKGFNTRSALKKIGVGVLFTTLLAIAINRESIKDEFNEFKTSVEKYANDVFKDFCSEANPKIPVR